MGSCSKDMSDSALPDWSKSEFTNLRRGRPEAATQMAGRPRTRVRGSDSAPSNREESYSGRRTITGGPTVRRAIRRRGCSAAAADRWGLCPRTAGFDRQPQSTREIGWSRTENVVWLS